MDKEENYTPQSLVGIDTRRTTLQFLSSTFSVRLPAPRTSHLVQRRTHDWYQEAIVEVVD